MEQRTSVSVGLSSKEAVMSQTEIDPTSPQPPSPVTPPGIPHQTPEELPQDAPEEFPEEVEEQPKFGSDT